MKGRLHALLALVLLTIAIIWSCDTRTSNVVGPGQEFNLNFAAQDTETVADEEVRMYAFVTNSFDSLISGVRLVFETLDFGYISPERYSSADPEDGISGTLYYDPKGEYGVCYLVARIASEDSIVEYSTQDTVIMNVHAYTLEFEAQLDSVAQSQPCELYCRVINPMSGAQVGDKHIKFYALDFGYVPPNMVNSSATNPSGMQSPVFFIAPSDTTGNARVAANVVWGTEEKIMGASSITIVVTN